jgi:hypothetical protein
LGGGGNLSEVLGEEYWLLDSSGTTIFNGLDLSPKGIETPVPLCFIGDETVKCVAPLFNPEGEGLDLGVT